MKKFNFFIFCACIRLSLFSQIGGDLDPTFGNSGKVIKSINSGQDLARGLAMLSDGSFLVVGETNSSITGKDFFCTKFLSNGAQDNSFGTNGTVTTDLQTGSEDIAYSVAEDGSTGYFVLAGSSSDGTKQSAALVRYKPNGQRDSTFGINGIALTNCIANNADAFHKVKMHALSGKIIAAGNSIYSVSNATAVIARYNSDGTPDASFNTTGINVFPTLGNAYTDLKDLYVAPSGKITAAGYTTDDNLSYLYDGWLTRLNSNGTPDLTFGTGGAMYEDYMSYNNAIYLDPGSGNIYTAGSVVAYFGTSDRNERMTIKRAGANGTDDSWAYAGSNPYHYTSPGGAPCYANTMCVAPNGEFFLAGTAYTNTQSAAILMKLQPTGGPDYTFGSPVSGQIVEDFGANYTAIFDMVLQPDGKIVVVGYTANDLFIARYFGTTVPQLNSFNLISPANNSTGLICSDVAMDWSDAPGAVGYEVEIDSVNTFANPDTIIKMVSEVPDYQLYLETATTYYWRVRAYNDDSAGTWKGPWKFTTSLDVINLITPANGAMQVTTAGTYFDWSDLPGSVSRPLNDFFEFQISASPSLSGAPIINPISFSSSNYTLSSTLSANTTYYWRVRSNRGIYKKGPWSAISNFTTGNPSAIDEAGSQGGIGIFPNPASDLLFITGSESVKILSAQLYDVHGRSISALIDDRKINLEGIPKGIYFLRLAGENASAYFRFLKE